MSNYVKIQISPMYLHKAQNSRACHIYIYIYIYALFSVLRVLIFRSVKDSVEKNAKYELRFRLDLFDGVQNTDGPSIWC